MKEHLKLKRYTDGFKRRSPEWVTVEVEYRRMKEIYGRAIRDEEKYYAIHVDGADEPVGYIDQVNVSTSRSPITSPIRWGIGSHTEWSWTLYQHTAEGTKWLGNRAHTSSYPGLYGKTRREAVADMLGFERHDVEVVKAVTA